MPSSGDVEVAVPVASAPVQEAPPAPSRRIDPSVAPAIMSQTFEDASPECNDWAAAGATSIRSVPSHSGDYACKLCATGDQTSFSLARALGKSLEPGHYAFRAWIRTRPLAPSPNGVNVVLEAETNAGTVGATQTAAVADEWTRIDVALDLNDAASGIRARIEAPAGETDQPCILVDDVTVVQTSRDE